MIRVLFICHGNICRSPMAEFLLKDILEKNDLQEEFEVASAATSTEEIWGPVGNPVYPPAQDELRKHGVGRTEYTDYRKKRAIQVTRRDYDYYDYILCADTMNIRNTIRITGPDREDKIRLLLDFSDRKGASIADPWYTGNFISTYNDIMEGLKGFLEYLGYEGLRGWQY